MKLNNDTVFSGFITGLIAGGLVTLFRGPRIRLNLSQTRTQIAEAVQETFSDPISESILEGKQAAQRRRSELGL